MKRFFTPRRITLLALLSLCCGAFVLRWPAVYFALPYTPHPDEPYVVNIVLRMLASGSLFPDSFDRPHLSVYPIWAALWLQQHYDPIPPALLTVPTDRITQVWTPFITGRIMSIALSILAIPLSFVHLRQRGHTFWAWVAAIWLTVLPFHIAQSGYIAPDGLVAVVTLLVLTLTWQYQAAPTPLRWWAVAVSVGLAIGTKYNLAAIVLIPAATHWEALRAGQWRFVLRQYMILAFGAVLGFFVTTPGLLVLAQQFLADMQSQVAHYSRHDAGNAPWAWWLYGDFFWNEGWPFVATPLVVLGTWRLVKTREPRDVALIAFLGIELVFFLSRERHYMRNLMPLVVCAPLAIATAGTWLTTIWRHDHTKRWVAPALAFCCIVPNVAGAVTQYRTMQLPYNRLVVDQLVGSLPAGAARVCSLDQFSVANTPSCSAATNKANEIDAWRHAGMQSFVAAGAAPVPTGMTVLQELPNTSHGGNGERFLVSTRDPHTDLTTIGTAALTSDGLRIDGIRLGAGAPRARLTPLDADATVTLRSDTSTLHVNLYATVTAPVTEPGWWLFVHLVNADGVVIAQRTTAPRTDYPISAWQPGELVLIPADVDLPAGAAAGTYTIRLGFYRPSDGARMVVAGASDGEWQTQVQLRR